MAAIHVASLLVLLLVSPAAVIGATKHQVSWTLSGDYSSWSTADVRVGDSMVFTYDNTHDVYVVDESGYNNCATTGSTFDDASGNTEYPLTVEGPVYFICSIIGHCPPMKLQVNVKAAASSTPTTNTTTPASPSPSTETTPTGTVSPSSPTGTVSPSSPTPPTSDNSGAALGGLSWSVVAATFILGSLLVFVR